MKQLFFLILIVAVTAACSTQKKVLEQNNSGKEQITVDTTEYDVETFDKRFEQWYKSYQKPSMYKSQAYYESWNYQYVTAWNAKCRRGGKDWHFEPVVGYKANEDYGFEMNHKLFYYFMYVENVLNISILPGGPKNYAP